MWVRDSWWIRQLESLTRCTHGCGSNPSRSGSWSLWLDVPMVMVQIQVDPFPDLICTSLWMYSLGGLVVVRSGLVDLLLEICIPVLPTSGSNCQQLNWLPHHFSQERLWGGWLDKNKICQRATVLESQWRPSSNYCCCLAVTFLWERLQEGFFLFVFFVPQLHLWGSPFLGEIFVYVTIFQSNH